MGSSMYCSILQSRQQSFAIRAYWQPFKNQMSKIVELWQTAKPFRHYILINIFHFLVAWLALSGFRLIASRQQCAYFVQNESETNCMNNNNHLIQFHFRLDIATTHEFVSQTFRQTPPTTLHSTVCGPYQFLRIQCANTWEMSKFGAESTPFIEFWLNLYADCDLK